MGFKRDEDDTLSATVVMDFTERSGDSEGDKTSGGCDAAGGLRTGGLVLAALRLIGRGRRNR